MKLKLPMIGKAATFSTLCSAALLGLVMTTSLASAQTTEDTLKLEYDFTGGGLRVLAATFDFTFDKKTYLVRSQLKTKGVANIFSKSISYLGARGTLDAQQAQPSEFQSRTENSKGQKTARIEWQPENQQKIEVSPLLDADRKISVDQALKSDFPDPLSALVAITISQGDLCRNKIRSFDGRKIFDFKLTYLGLETLRKGEAGSYFGPAHKCSFKNIPIAGYSKKKMKKYRAKPTPAYTVWFAPIGSAATGKTIFVPVKAVGTINWASVNVKLTKGTLNGRPFSTIR
jgi:Protein of unknown function (DUF3108)